MLRNRTRPTIVRLSISAKSCTARSVCLTRTFGTAKRSWQQRHSADKLIRFAAYSLISETALSSAGSSWTCSPHLPAASPARGLRSLARPGGQAPSRPRSCRGPAHPSPGVPRARARARGSSGCQPDDVPAGLRLDSGHRHSTARMAHPQKAPDRFRESWRRSFSGFRGDSEDGLNCAKSSAVTWPDIQMPLTAEPTVHLVVSLSSPWDRPVRRRDS